MMNMGYNSIKGAMLFQRSIAFFVHEFVGLKLSQKSGGELVEKWWKTRVFWLITQ